MHGYSGKSEDGRPQILDPLPFTDYHAEPLFPLGMEDASSFLERMDTLGKFNILTGCGFGSNLQPIQTLHAARHFKDRTARAESSGVRPVL